VDGTTNIIPKMNLEVLHKVFKAVINTMYAPANYYVRVKTFLQEFKAPNIRVAPDFEYILAFVRSTPGHS
jgi:hypothetical protein